MGAPLTPVQFLRRAEQNYPDHTAVVCMGKRYTYAQFAARVGQLAGALRTGGVQPGERIALVSCNCHRLLEARYGVLEARAVLVPLGTHFAPGELADVLNTAGAAIAFLDTSHMQFVDFFRKHSGSVRRFIALDEDGQANGGDNYEDLLASAHPYRSNINDLDEDAPAEVHYTAATGANLTLTHREAHHQALGPSVIGTRDALLHAMPLWHHRGSKAAHQVTMSGGTHVMLRDFDPVEAFRLIARERVNGCYLASSMALALLRSSERHEFELRSLKWLVIDGPRSSSTLAQEIKEKLRCDCFYGDSPEGRGTGGPATPAFWETAHA